MGNTDEDISKYAAFEAASRAPAHVAAFMRRDEGSAVRLRSHRAARAVKSSVRTRALATGPGQMEGVTCCAL